MQTTHSRSWLVAAIRAVAEVSPFAAKDRTFKTVRPESGNRQRDCSDPQTAAVVNHQDRPG
jgi:hypothetical protein